MTEQLLFFIETMCYLFFKCLCCISDEQKLFLFGNSQVYAFYPWLFTKLKSLTDAGLALIILTFEIEFSTIISKWMTWISKGIGDPPPVESNLCFPAISFSADVTTLLKEDGPSVALIV